MKSICWSLLTLVGLALAATPLHAAATFSENFNGSGVSSHLVVPTGWSFGGTAKRTNNTTRNYIATADSDYLAHDFTYEITYTVPVSPGGEPIAYVGFGDGNLNPNFFNEPANAYHLRTLPDGFAGGETVLYASDGDENFGGGPTVLAQNLHTYSAVGTGTHRARLSKNGGNLTVAIDKDYAGGAFTIDETKTVALGGVEHPVLNNSNSRLFFGTQAGTVTTFDNMQVTLSSGVINVDLNGSFPGFPAAVNYASTAAAPDNGTFWNSLAQHGVSPTPVSISNLRTSDGGHVTNVSLTVGTGTTTGFGINDGPGGLFNDSGNPLLDDAIVQDPNNGVSQEAFFIDGLDPNQLYALYLYGTNGGSEGLGTRFGVDVSGTGVMVEQLTSGGNGETGLSPDPDNDDFLLGVNYVLFPKVRPDLTGRIDGYWGGTGAVNSGNFNGLQITAAVPEPSTLALLAAGVAVVCGLRRRTRR